MNPIDIIIVNYNGEELLVHCLGSLSEQTFKDFRLIIVDNNSHDGSIDVLNGYLQNNVFRHSPVVIKLEKNFGFAEANVQALKYSNSEYVVTLNFDTETNQNWLEELHSNIEPEKDIGICASKLVVHGTNKIDSSGDLFTTLLRGDKRGEGRNTEDFKQKEHVFGACAGAALYRRKMLEQIGFFDEDFFLIHEDTDLNFRAQLAGWKVLYVPTAVVHHKVRSSIGVMSDTAVYYSLRNSELVRIKNVSFGVFLICFPEFILGVISEFLYFAVKHKRFRLYIKAKRDALKMLPRMWEKRKIIMKTKKVTDRYLLSLMTPIWQKDFFKAKLGKFLHG